MIKKRNLDNSLIQWIMTVTGLGPGIGEIKYMAKTASATSQYRTQLQSMGIDDDDMFTTLATTYAALVKNRNDIILVMPGAYDEAATLDWTKDNLHILGLGGPNTASDYSEANTVIYTDTSAVDFTIDLTGDHCQFINIGINNAGNHATSYAAMRVNGYGNVFENASFIGNLGASQRSAVACASLYIHVNAHNCRWNNCVIGEDCWGSRSGALSGQLRFSSTSQPNGGIFKNCYFRSMAATATVAMVAIPANGAVGRGWKFEDCTFHNFYTASSSSNLNQVFYINDNTGTNAITMLKDCAAIGFDCWQDNDYDKIRSNMPAWYSGGGLTSEPLLTVSGGA